MYSLIYSPTSKEGLAKLRKSDPSAFRKAVKLLNDLMEHPTTGTGHPHPLSGDRTGQWSRSITKKHRLVYQINECEVIVLVLSAYGHYDDK